MTGLCWIVVPVTQLDLRRTSAQGASKHFMSCLCRIWKWVKSLSDILSRAKLGKYILQKAETDLESRHALISSCFLKFAKGPIYLTLPKSKIPLDSFKLTSRLMIGGFRQFVFEKKKI